MKKRIIPFLLMLMLFAVLLCSAGTVCFAEESMEFVWPVPGYYQIIRPFGQIVWGSGPTKGIEISDSDIYGATVIAAESGAVVKASDLGDGYGICIEIDHENGYQTRYCHLAASLVGVGETVRKGQPIGEVGNTGDSSGPHLYFEMIEDDAPIDPLSVFESNENVNDASVFSEGSIRIIIGCVALLIGIVLGLMIGKKVYAEKSNSRNRI